MKTFTYCTEQILSTDINTAWDFFSSAKNLSVITPPEMDFRILSNLDEIDIYEGMLIDYTVKPLFGIKLKWQTEIIKVNKPKSFVDRQLKGPYKMWQHTHTFSQIKAGILMQDEVIYQIPYGIFGEIANWLMVKKKITNIFSFRRDTLDKIFNKNANNIN
jgi:ligand-binding SRPBCC domain-containing protein